MEYTTLFLRDRIQTDACMKRIHMINVFGIHRIEVRNQSASHTTPVLPQRSITYRNEKESPLVGDPQDNEDDSALFENIMEPNKGKKGSIVLSFVCLSFCRFEKLPRIAPLF